MQELPETRVQSRVGKNPGGGNGNPLHILAWRMSPMDGGAWRAAVRGDANVQRWAEEGVGQDGPRAVALTCVPGSESRSGLHREHGGGESGTSIHRALPVGALHRQARGGGDSPGGPACPPLQGTQVQSLGRSLRSHTATGQLSPTQSKGQGDHNQKLITERSWRII